MAIGRPHLVIATAVAAALLPAPCTFSQIPHSQGVVPAEAVAGDQFGYSVAVSGNRAVVGAPGDDERGGDAGAVYILERVGGTWSVVGKLLATDAVGGWNFGFSVDVWGDRIVVGAPTASVAGELFGAAYVFERIAGQWIQTAQLSPTPLAGSFGHDVAIHGDFIAVGASGRVTFFQRINGTWTQIGTGSFSGSVSVDLDGLRAVSGGFHSVTISEFDGTTFATTQILPLPIGDASVDAVTIHGDTIVVGASADDPIDAGVNTGAAYIVRRIGDTWTHEQTLAGAFAGDHFGASVALSDDLLLVGAPRADVTGFDSGAAVLFQRIGTSWFWVDEMVASGADLYADFGTSVALDGAHGFVGRPALLVPNGSSGSAHFYLLADCDTDGLVDAIEIALGLGVDCNENWVLDSCELAAGAPDVNGNNVLDVCESDCNDNGIPDTMEIALGFVADCNANGRPDDCDLRPRPVDLVFIMDTSGSMDDEGQALCAAIDLVGQTLQQQGIDLNATLYGITSLGYGCLSNTVAAALGPAIPQPAPCCPEIMMVEDWGGAVAIVAERQPWRDEARRIIVPISDEGPAGGDPLDNNDTSVILAATAVAQTHGVVVSPILGTGSTTELLSLAQQLAEPTGGIAFLTVDPNADLAGLILAIAIESTDCDGNRYPDDCQVMSVSYASPAMGPIGAGTPRSYVLTGAPKSGNDVDIRFEAKADLGAALEYLEVALDGTPLGAIYLSNAADCPADPSVANLVVPRQLFNDAVADGTATFHITASSSVDPNACPGGSWVQLSFGYQAQIPGDCDGDGTPDACQIFADPTLDLDGNGTLDSCQTSPVTTGDLNNDGSVDGADLGALLAAWGACPPVAECPADFNGDGVVDGADLGALLAAWGTN